MSAPFIIWTMQRTGGTSLADLLMEMSEHTAAEHEPFNWAKKNPRQFWPISDAWNKSGDTQQLRQSLKGIFEQKFLIKHCYELLNLTFNLHLIDESSATTYRHIILQRRDEPSRLISKFIAEGEGTWFKDYSRKVFAEVAVGERKLKDLPIDRLVGHYRHCQNASKFVKDALEVFRAASHTVFFEDIYLGERETRLEKITDLFDFLQFSEEDVQKHSALINEKLFDSGQNTASVATRVPNYRQALQALEANGCDAATRLLKEDAVAGAETLPCTAASDPATLNCSSVIDEPVDSRARIAHNVVTMAKQSGAHGPFLEISNLPLHRAVLNDRYFASEERHVLSKLDSGESGSLIMRKGDFRELKDYKVSHFGTVLWIDSLATDEHFWRTLSEVRRVLKPGGVFIAVTPSFGKVDQGSVVIKGAKGNSIPNVTITQRVRPASDYWRISSQCMREVVFQGCDVTELQVKMVPPRLFGAATKQGDRTLGNNARTRVDLLEG